MGVDAWGEWAATPGLLAGAAGLLGLVVGSFLNVVIHRLPRGESVVHPRSRCPRCGATIRAADNIPVLSWLWLRGRCRHCAAPISPRYPALELLTGALFAGLALRFGAVAALPLWLAFGALLVGIAAIDAEHQIVPDELSLGLLALGLVAMPGLGVATGGAGPWDALRGPLLGAVIGGGSLWLVGFAHARVSVALGRRFAHWPGEDEAPPRPASLDYWTWFPGLGFGDVKLMAGVGAFLGPTGVMEAILVAAVVGLGVGGAIALARRQAGVPFGFAPALAAGSLLVVLVPHPPLGAMLLRIL